MISLIFVSCTMTNKEIYLHVHVEESSHGLQMILSYMYNYYTFTDPVNVYLQNYSQQQSCSILF